MRITHVPVTVEFIPQESFQTAILQTFLTRLQAKQISLVILNEHDMHIKVQFSNNTAYILDCPKILKDKISEN